MALAAERTLFLRHAARVYVPRCRAMEQLMILPDQVSMILGQKQETLIDRDVRDVARQQPVRDDGCEAAVDGIIGR